MAAPIQHDIMELVAGENFYTATPLFTEFSQVCDIARYAPIPDEWVIGVCDIVSSRTAIAEGRYKAVNMAGASVITALGNGLSAETPRAKTKSLQTNEPSLFDFPYVFGGDGVSFALPASLAPKAAQIMAATSAWIASDLDLTMRTAMISVQALRALGQDVRLARFAASGTVSYALFCGGGLALAERLMKQDKISLKAFLPQVPEPLPTLDFSGLSCRFDAVPARNGEIVSLLVVPVKSEQDPDFQELIAKLLAIVEAAPITTHPLSYERLKTRWPPKGFLLEVRAMVGSGRRMMGKLAQKSLWMAGIKVLGHTLLASLIFAFGRTVGGFSPKRYKRELIENSDFRKYDDGLRMTLDCAPALADQLEVELKAAFMNNIARYGLYRQTSALITCIVPSALNSRHFHFIDGASGGYAKAADALTHLS